MTDNYFGWATPPDDIIEKYVEAVNLFLNDTRAFATFKTHENYTPILSGQDKIIGELNLELIQSDPQVHRLFLSHLREIKENDIIGTPTIHDYGKYKMMAADTIKYGYNASYIKHNLKEEPIKKIVEIGSGYGAMAKILHSFVQFDSYTMIDLPIVVKLCKKYLDHFPAIKDKMTYIGCDELDEIKKIGPIDLVIADSSMSECDLQSLKFYTTNVVDQSSYTYLIHNTNHINSQRTWFHNFVNNKRELNNWSINLVNLLNSGVYQCWINKTTRETTQDQRIRQEHI